MRKRRFDRVRTFGGIFIRAQLIAFGIGAIGVGIAFIFVPVDGPIGEIAFGTIGLVALFAGLTGRPPSRAEFTSAVRATGVRR